MADTSESQHAPQPLNSPDAVITYLTESSHELASTVPPERRFPDGAFLISLYDSGSYQPINDPSRIENRIRIAAQSGEYTKLLEELRGEIERWREAYSNYTELGPRTVEGIVWEYAIDPANNTTYFTTNESTHERISRRLTTLRFSMLLVAANMAAGQLNSLEDIAEHFAAPTAQHSIAELGLISSHFSATKGQFAIQAIPAAYSLSFESDSQSHFPPMYDFFNVSSFEELVNNIRVIQLIKLVKDKVSQTDDIRTLSQELNAALLSCPTEYRDLIYDRMQIFSQYRLLEGSDPVAYLTRALIEHAAMPVKRPITARTALAKWVDLSTPLDRTLTLQELHSMSTDEATALKPFILALVTLKNRIKRGEYGSQNPMKTTGLDSMNLDKLYEFILRLIGEIRSGQTGHSNRF